MEAKKIEYKYDIVIRFNKSVLDDTKSCNTYGIWNESMMNEPMEKVWLQSTDIQKKKVNPLEDMIQMDMFKNL